MDDAEQIEDFLREMTAPPRRRPVPRIAEPLRALDIEDVQGPQGRIAAWRLGEGPAVLLVHGFEDDNALWTPMLDTLSARGRAAVAFDLPAHGLSDGESGLSQEAAEAIFAVSRALGPIDAIVGHSLGGWAAAQAVSEGLDMQRLVVMAAPFAPVIERWRRTAARMGYAEGVAEGALALHEQRAGPTRELSDVLQDVTASTLLIHSRTDERAPFAAAEAAYARCVGAHMIALEDANHRETAQHAEAIAATVLFCEGD